MRHESHSRKLRALACLATLACVPSMLACQSPRADWLQPRDELYVEFYENVVDTLLDGYRVPATSDFKTYWRMLGGFPYQTTDDDAETKAPFWTKGLFNADDIVDWAFLLVDEDGESLSLFAIVSSSGGYDAVLLGDGIQEEMGLATALPRTFRAQPDGASEWTQVELVRDGIAFIRFESHSSVFVWDEAEARFKRYWIS